MTDDTKQLLLGFTIAGLVFALLIPAITIPAFFFNKSACYNTAKQMGFNADYGITTSCMIEVDSKWIPLRSYRYYK